MKKTFTVIRVSAEDQLKGYGPDIQWEDDVLPNAPLLGLEVSEEYRRIIQESATGWERSKFESTIREEIDLHCQGRIQALLFPRIDRETRFIFSSAPILALALQADIEVYFARERFNLDPNDPDSVDYYMRKAVHAQEYAKVFRENTRSGIMRRACGTETKPPKMPSGRGILYGYDYNRETG